MSNAELLDMMKYFVVGCAALWGALWGSFANVVIARLPEGRSVISPPSACMRCKSRLRWYDNIPIISYLWLRGRCRSCGVAYGSRYVWVEAITAALCGAVTCLWWNSRLLDTQTVVQTVDLSLFLARILIATSFIIVMIIIAYIDFDTMRIPNVLTYPGIPLSIAASQFLGQISLKESIIGAVVGYLLIRLIADGYRLLTGRFGMGYGDGKLLAMIGGLMGWKIILPIMLLASVQGSVIGIALLLWQRRAADATHSNSDSNTSGLDSPEKIRHVRIPFGPFIALAALQCLLALPAMHRIFTSLYPEL